MFFLFPPAFACTAAVLPVSGNPNLFLNANTFTGPPVRTSAFGGLTPDRVSFTTSPFAQFFPIFGVVGALSSLGTFAGASFGLP